MEELIELLKLTEFQLKIKLYKYLKQQEMSPIFRDGFIYAKGDIPILLVAHMDTVLPKPPKKFFHDSKYDTLFSFDGIGGDDRCGVYAIMKILEEYHPHVLFTEKEEIGGIGALKAVKYLEKPTVKYIIELDRQGNNDCVFYECGNQEFIGYIESFDFVTNYGTFSDISILAKSWNIAAVNISSAYYNEHTEDECIKFNQLQMIIDRIKGIIKDHHNAKTFDFQQKSNYSNEYAGLYQPELSVLRNDNYEEEISEEYCKKLMPKYNNLNKKG